MAEPDDVANANPPRYTIESDDEDEYNPQSRTSDNLADVVIRFSDQIPSGLPLVYVSGDAGQAWTRGVLLGEQKGAIYVDEEQVGHLYLPSWTRAAVLVSESCSRLPLSKMNKYATAIRNRMQPTSVAMLDLYSIQGYISPKVTPLDSAPVRYLSTGSISISDPELEQFSPPNLLQSTTAALLTSFSLTRPDSNPNDLCDGVLFLLPSPKLSLPGHVDSSSLLSCGEGHWDHKTMQKVHVWLFSAVDSGDSLPHWVETRIRSTHLPNTRDQHRIGEGSMYI